MKNITEYDLWDFQKMLYRDEMSEGTIKKYLRDVRKFCEFVDGRSIDIEVVIEYKRRLSEIYAVNTANSMLASLNRFFRFMRWHDCVVKSFRIQSSPIRSKDRELSLEEYRRLVKVAEMRGNIRLSLLLQTLASTGIRIGELPFITLEAVKEGKAAVMLKGKTRFVPLPSKLCEKLLEYSTCQNIPSGSLFITRNGKPMDRSNVLHEMKELCKEAQVEEHKVFPHNFRHLFACQFYQATNDMTHLADILGHTSLNTTRIYTAVSWEEQLQWMNQIKLVI